MTRERWCAVLFGLAVLAIPIGVAAAFITAALKALP